MSDVSVRRVHSVERSPHRRGKQGETRRFKCSGETASVCVHRAASLQEGGSEEAAVANWLAPLR